MSFFLRAIAIQLSVLIGIPFLQSTLFSQTISFPNETWEVVQPEEMFVDSGALEEAVSKIHDSSKMMVIRNGRVLWQGDDVDIAHPVYSITKSFASTAMGLLVDDELVSLTDKAADFNPALTDLYPDVTVEHLLTQTSGIEGNILKPSKPAFTPPGSQFAYNTKGANDALSHVVSTVSGQPLEELIQSRIAEPIGMDLTSLSFGETTIQDGDESALINTANTDLMISASNLARFGLLVMNGGEWNGESLISKEWVDNAIQVQVTDVPNHPSSGGPFVDQYGYGWWRFDPNWIDSIGINNNRLMFSPRSGFVVTSLGFSTVPNQGALVGKFIDDLEEADIPFEWDERGDGTWHAQDPRTGKTRWVAAGTNTHSAPLGIAIVRTNSVQVERDLLAKKIDLESGSLSITETAKLDTTVIGVSPGASLRIDGHAKVKEFVSKGDIVVGDSGSLFADNIHIQQGAFHLNGAVEASRLTVDAGTELTVSGELSLETLAMRKDARLTIHDSGHALVSERHHATPRSDPKLCRERRLLGLSTLTQTGTRANEGRIED